MERQRAHREAQAPALSEAEAAHLAMIEAIGEGQRAQAESDATSAAGTDAGSDHAVTPPESGVRAGRARDPRLGAYRNVGAFLHHCWGRLGFSRSDVYAVAGLASAEKPERLLDFPGGGLHALYEACEATKKGRAA